MSQFAAAASPRMKLWTTLCGFAMAFMFAGILGFLCAMSSVYIGAIGLEGKDQFIILRGDEQAYARMERAPAIWERMPPEDRAFSSKERLQADRANLVPTLLDSSIEFACYGLALYTAFWFARRGFAKARNARRVTSISAVAVLAISVSCRMVQAQTTAETGQNVQTAPSAATKTLWKGAVRSARPANTSKKDESKKTRTNAILRQPEALAYIKSVHQRISGNWHPVKGSEPVEIAFKVAPDGSLVYAHMHKSSGIADCDKAAMNAMQNAAPFPPVPGGIEMFDEFIFGFDKNSVDHDGHGLTTMHGRFLPDK